MSRTLQDLNSYLLDPMGGSSSEPDMYRAMLLHTLLGTATSKHASLDNTFQLIIEMRLEGVLEAIGATEKWDRAEYRAAENMMKFFREKALTCLTSLFSEASHDAEHINSYDLVLFNSAVFIWDLPAQAYDALSGKIKKARHTMTKSLPPPGNPPKDLA